MSGLLFIGLVIAVLVLCSKLGEARHQLDQARHERDVYERIYEDMLSADVRRSGTRVPPNYGDMPEWWRQ